jgi:antitoxin component YwqK of YwqJK toxin-antitoxin module
MNKLLMSLLVLVLAQTIAAAQQIAEKVAFVVDSVTIMNDPEEDDILSETDIADMRIIRDKDSLKQLGFEKFDVATFYFTRAYRNRSALLKSVPSLKQLSKNGNNYLQNGVLYSGPFVDYFLNGSLQSKGEILNGKLVGIKTVYYHNGKIKLEMPYRQGLLTGIERRYYEDGSLKEKGSYAANEEEGLWETYYPNGKIKERSTYMLGHVVDTTTRYYSNGKIEEKVYLKNGEVTNDQPAKTNKWMIKSAENALSGDYKAAVKFATKALETDSSIVDAYVLRGTYKIELTQFDEAIADFDKALVLEPYMQYALANRGLARIAKYESANGRVLSKGNGVTVMAVKEKTSIPKADQEKICADLHQARFLGDKSKKVKEAIATHCEVSSQ